MTKKKSMWVVVVLTCAFRLPALRRPSPRTAWEFCPRQELQEVMKGYINATDVEELPDDVVYYVAVADAHPIALLTASVFSLYGEPIADVCCVNTFAIDQLNITENIWRSFAARYSCVPLFHTETLFYTTDTDDAFSTAVRESAFSFF